MINQCRWGMSLGLRSELSSTIEQNRTCSPPRLSISCHKGKLSLPLDISRLNSVIQLHQSWLSKGVNLDSERHVAQRFLQHVMEMLPDSIWMCYWTVCHLTTRVTTSQNQRSHAVNALCILSTLSESPSVNFKKVTDVLHNYLLYIYLFVTFCNMFYCSILFLHFWTATGPRFQDVVATSTHGSCHVWLWSVAQCPPEYRFIRKAIPYVARSSSEM